MSGSECEEEFSIPAAKRMKTQTTIKKNYNTYPLTWILDNNIDLDCPIPLEDYKTLAQQLADSQEDYALSKTQTSITTNMITLMKTVYKEIAGKNGSAPGQPISLGSLKNFLQLHSSESYSTTLYPRSSVVWLNNWLKEFQRDGSTTAFSSLVSILKKIPGEAQEIPLDTYTSSTIAPSTNPIADAPQSQPSEPSTLDLSEDPMEALLCALPNNVVKSTSTGSLVISQTVS